MLSYDGTAYFGWQTQPGVPTIQRVVTQAARTVLGPATRVTGASRTDAGVHALGQVASLTTEAGLPADAVLRALNAALPRDIRVRAVAEVAPGFNARRAATVKRYGFLIDNGPVAEPLLLRYAWHVLQPLDERLMRRALEALRGRHDFSAFRAAPAKNQSPVCAVRAVHVIRRRRRVAILISADRFVHHMVRNIVGSAVVVGRGARPPEWLAGVLGSQDRRLAGPTAPAHGLFLIRVLF